MDDAALACLNFPRLKTLDVSWCAAVTDRGLKQMCAALGPSLEALSISGCVSVTDDGVGCIVAGCLSLVDLDMAWCHQVSNSCCVMLKLLPSLTSLDLTGT